MSQLPVGTIKVDPEDFRVQEVPHHGQICQHVSETSLSGATSPYTLFVLTKRGIGGEDAYGEVARQLGVLREAVSDHGLKDSCAITSQRIVVEGDFIPEFSHDQLWLQQIGPTDGPLRQGGHAGNRFTIMVYTESGRPMVPRRFRNLYGYQRFGGRSAQVGRYMLEGNFSVAAELLGAKSRNGKKLAQLQGQNRTLRAAVLSDEFSYECGFLVNQWLSWLWNQLAEETDEKWLPFWSSAETRRYVDWWDPEHLDQEVLSRAHAFSRPVWVVPTNVMVLPKSGGWQLSFTLGSGSYATVLLETLYNLQDVSRQPSLLRAAE